MKLTRIERQGGRLYAYIRLREEERWLWHTNGSQTRLGVGMGREVEDRLSGCTRVEDAEDVLSEFGVDWTRNDEIPDRVWDKLYKY